MLIACKSVVDLIKPKQKVDVVTWISSNVEGYSFDKAPYFKEIAKDIQNPKIKTLVCYKSSQIGYSLFCRAVLAYLLANDPANVMYVLPTATSIANENNDRIYPTLRKIQDVKILAKVKDKITLVDCFVYFGSGENSNSLKSVSCRYVFSDEIDEFPKSVEGEGTPLELAEARSISFTANKKMMFGSTPKEGGYISKLWDMSTDQRIYHVPCPHCKHYQELKFDNLKWQKVEGKTHIELSAQIEDCPSLCWYECEKCKARLTETDKRGMIARGVWLSVGQWVEGGEVKGARPIASRVGYKINALISTWFPWSALAAKWLQTCDDPNQRRAFLSHYLGQLPKPRERAISSGNVSLARSEQQQAQQLGIVRGVVPNFAGLLCCGVDVQKDRVYWVLRAFGRVKSQLVDYGVATSLDDVLAVLNRSYSSPSGRQFHVDGMAIDFGGWSTKVVEEVEDQNAKRKVFNFADADERIYPCKGHGNKSREAVLCQTDAVYNREYLAVQSNVLLSNIFELRESKLWLSNSCVDDGYISSIDSVVPMSDGTFKQGSNNHYFDAEVYCQAMAMHLDQSNLPSEEEIERMGQQREIRQETKLDVSGLLPTYAKKWS